MNNESAKKLYDALSVRYDLGTFDKFTEGLQDENRRRKIYDAVIGTHDLGDYDTFISKLGLTTASDGSVRIAEEAEETGVIRKALRGAKKIMAKEPKEVITPATPEEIAQIENFNNANIFPQIQDTNLPFRTIEEKKESARIEEQIAAEEAALAAHREAERKRLHEDGTIDRMKEAKKEAGKRKRRALISAMGHAAILGEGMVTDEIADYVQDKTDEWAQNKLLHQRLDETLDMARQGELNADGSLGVMDAARGAWDSATRLSTWDVGISETLNAITYYDLVKKWEENPESLTATENALLDAIAETEYIKSLYSDQTGFWYGVGQSLPQSAAFMAETMLNPANALSQTAMKKVVRELGKRGVSAAARRSAGIATRVVGDVAEAAIGTATTRAGHVIGGAIDRNLGSMDFRVDNNGYVHYNGQEDDGVGGWEAMSKEFGAQFLGGYSEKIGATLIDPALDVLRGVTKGAVTFERLDKFVDALNNTKASKLMNGISNLRKKAHLDSTLAEILEEEFDMLMNARFIGDNNFGDPSDPNSVFNLRNQLTTIASTALTMFGINAVESAGNYANKRTWEKQVAEFDKAAGKLYGDGWESLRESIDMKSPQEVVDELTGIFMNQDVTLAQKRAIMNYAMGRIGLQSYNVMDKKVRDELYFEKRNALDAYEAGRHAQLPQYYNIDQEYRSSEAAINERENAEEIWDAIRLMNNMDENERQNIMRDFSEEDQQLIRNWRYNAMRWQGAINHRAEQVEDLVDEYRGQVTPYTRPDGTLTTAILGDDVVYVMNEAENGDAVVYTNDGRKIFCKMRDLEHVQQHNAEELIERFRQQTTQAVEAETEKNLNYPSEVQEPAQGVTVETLDGKRWEVVSTDGENVQLAEMIYDKKSGQWLTNAFDGAGRKMTREQFMDWQKAELDRKKANTYEQGDELTFYVNGEPISAEITGITPDGDYTVQISHLADGLDKSVSDVYTAEELRKLTTPPAATTSQHTTNNLSANDAQNEGASTDEIKQSVSGEVANSQNGYIGRTMTLEEANAFIPQMVQMADPSIELEFTPENWVAEFGEDGMVPTPIGDVKMGENQYFKLSQKKRTAYFGMVKPTLTNPDLILEEYDPKDGAERDTKLIFVKTFIKPDGSRTVNFESVTVKKGGFEVSISSHEIDNEQLFKKVQQDKLLHLNEKFSSSELRLTEPLQEGSDLVPTPNSVSSNTKGSGNVSDVQENSQENNLNSSNLDAGQNISAIARVPKDAKGNPLYEQTDADTAWDAIMEQTEGDAEMAQRIADEMVADKKAALTKMQKGKPKKGATVAEKIANEKAHVAAIAQAEAEVAAWEKIARVNAIRQQSAELERAEADENVAQEEASFAEFGEAAMEAASEILANQAPMNGVELAAAMLSGNGKRKIRLDPESFRRHTGYSTAEQRMFPGLFAKKENGGVSVERFGELVELADREDGTHFFEEGDVNAGLNAVLEVLGQAKTMKDINQYIARQREAAAYSVAASVQNQEDRAMQEAKDAWYMEQYHATEEELAAYNEYLAEFVEEIYGEDSDYEQRIATFAEIQLEYDNQGTDADLRSSADQGEGLASDREGGRSVGETEQLNQREVLGDAAGVAASEDQGIGSSVSAQSDVDAEAEAMAKVTLQRIEELDGEIVDLEDRISELEEQRDATELSGEYELYEEQIESLRIRLNEAETERDGLLSLGVENEGERDYREHLSSVIYEIESELGALTADNAETYVKSLFDNFKWETLEEADDALRQIFKLQDGKVNSLAILPYFDAAQKEARKLSHGLKTDQKTLSNGDVVITNYDSNGKLSAVTIERDGKVISVGTYEDGALFERTDYDANGNATKVTRYKDGEVVSEQEYKDGKRKVTANYFEMAEEAQKKRKEKKNVRDIQEKEKGKVESERGDRPRLGKVSFSEFTELVQRLIEKAYRGVAPTEEVARIIREHNNGKTLLAHNANEQKLLKALRVMTNEHIDGLLNEIQETLQSGEIKDAEERKAYEDAVALIDRFKKRGERKAIVKALTGANLGEKLPLSKIDELFKMYNSDADVAELYRRVRAIAEQIGLDFWFEEGMGNQLGGYLHIDNRVRLNAHTLYSPYVSQQTKASNILHEMLHAVVGYAVKTQEDVKMGLTPAVKLSKQVLNAANTIAKIYEKAVKDNPLLVHEQFNPDTNEMEMVADYGTTSVEEMLMEISNPEFRDKLKQIEYNGRSVWQRIWDAIKSMFTQSSDVTNPTAYDSMAKALDVLINEFSVDAYRKYSGLEESASRVYHGSGADFDKFDHSFMGTGEGNQAFGWGTYVTEVEGIGRTYADIAYGKKGENANDAQEWLSENPDYKTFIEQGEGKRRKDDIETAKKYYDEKIEEAKRNSDDAAAKEWSDFLEEEIKTREYEISEQRYNQIRDILKQRAGARMLYSVEIPDDNGGNYLKWYENVPKEVLAKAKAKLYGVLVEGDYKGAERELKRELDDLFALEQTGQNLYGNISAYLGSDKEASQFLNEMGYVGIKYPTNTLHGGNIDGTNNYVIFDENDLEIVDNIRFRDGVPFFSNAERAVENIKQQKATPEQWLAMIKKDGGLKAGEDKWMGLSDWLNEKKEDGVKSLTKDEVLAFIRENQIEIEEVEYKEFGDDYTEGDLIDDVAKGVAKEYGWNFSDEFVEAFDISVDDYYNRILVRISDDEKALALFNEATNDNLELDGDDRIERNDARRVQDWAKSLVEQSSTRKIPLPMRLSHTTEGLENKQEIAFVVPTIEPWNQSDEIHFGDAGDGRAVAWVRFGETTDADGNRVLVIDEVQSKRHDEGRAKGYQSKEKGDLLAERDRLYDKMYRDGLTEEEFNRRNEINARLEELGEGRIPDAPFDKNYHELVMKRMLRYAAENGFDKVAWTKGAQQARRYGLNTVFDTIKRKDNPNLQGRRFMLTGTDLDFIRVGSDGVVVDTAIADANGKTLESVVGVDMAKQMMSLEDGDVIEGQDLAIGGEGMKGYYDEIIPRFMNKYVKKWGTTVGEVTLPEVEKAGRTMWSVDVTPEMRESVMQGQPMFREGMGAISDREVSYENDPIAKFDGKPRYYGKRAAAFAERERKRMQKGVEEAAKILGIEVEIITDASALKGRKAKAKGWYDINSKKVVVVIPNHVSKWDAVQTVLHEGVAHHGLRELFGDGFDAMLDNIYNNVAPELKARIDAIAERTGVSTSVATEEYLASLAEETNFEEAKNRGWWAKIKNYFAKMLNKLGMPGLNLKEEITDNELRFLLWRSYQNLVDPNRYLKPLSYLDDVAKQKELKVGEYAENTMATPRAAEMSEAEEWSAVTMQRIEELEAQAAQLENEIADMEADRDADDASRYDIWEQQIGPLREQLDDVYAEIEGLYSLEAEDEGIADYEAEREAEKQSQLYQKRIDNAYLKAVREGNWEEATDLFRQYVLSKAEDEGIAPMDFGVGYRGGAHSSIAKKVKEENPDAIAEAAYQMSIRIPRGSILVPMPSHNGNATYTVKLAEAIAKATDSEVRDVLKGKARMSVYEAKQKGIKMTPEDLGMYTTEELPKGKNIVIIDNVIDKGTTALAAVSAVKGASVVAYAYTLGDKSRVAPLKLAEPVTYDNNMRIIPLSERFNPEVDDIRYRMSQNDAEFEATQKRAVEEVGIVADGLNEAVIDVVRVPIHDFTGSLKEVRRKAKEWAVENYAGKEFDLPDNAGRYTISNNAINKYLDKSAFDKSDSASVHLSILKMLPEIIRKSIEAEIHADYAKGENGERSADNGVKNNDLLVHRIYGATNIDGNTYRVKTTIHEFKDSNTANTPHSYEVTKIELIEDSTVTPNDGIDNPLNRSVSSISAAKLLKGVEKSYDKGKLLLDESKKVSKDSRNSEEIISEVEREAAALGVPVRIVRSVDELPDEDTRKRAVDGQLKGYFDPRTGEVVVYEPNTDDANDAKRTVLHEIVGHKGLRQLIGEERYDKAMVQLMYMLPSEVRDAVLRRAERNGWNAAIAMDEYLAEQAERDVQPTWWGKVNAKIRAILRNLGFDVKLTDADVTYLLWRSRRKLMGDTAFDMATDAILRQAARKSAEADAWSEQAFKDAEMRDFEKGAMQRLRNRIGDAQNEYDSAMKSMAFKQKEAWQDSMRSLKVFMDIVSKESGKKIADFENAYMYENAMSSANLMGSSLI